jgi:hypothetical protein
MLSYAALLPPQQKRQSLATKRRVTVPKQLNFLDIASPETCVWQRLDQQPRTKLIAALAQLIAKAALSNKTQEHNHDRYGPESISDEESNRATESELSEQSYSRETTLATIGLVHIGPSSGNPGAANQPDPGAQP